MAKKKKKPLPKPPLKQPGAAEKFLEFLVQRQGIIFPLAIAIVGLVVYVNTFHVPLVYDDLRFINDNPGIRTFSFSQFPTLFGATRQVGLFTFFLNYRLSGLNVVGFHVLNILIHLGSAILVYALVLLTLRTPFFRDHLKKPLTKTAAGLMALLAGLIFVSHPVETQAVTYISQRFTSLATLFYLASILAYVKWRMTSSSEDGDRHTDDADGGGAFFRRKDSLFLAASIVFAVLSMRTKEISYTLPVVIAVYEFTFFTGGIKKRIVNLLPMLATLLMIPINLLPGVVTTEDSIQLMRGDTAVFSSVDYLLTQFRVIVTYLRLFFLPVNQNLDYAYPLYTSFLNPNVFLSFILLAAIFLAGVYFFRRSRSKDPLLRLSAFGIAWFFITLSVESSINPLGNLIDEHRLYLPSIGLIIALMGLAWTAWDRFEIRLPRINRFLIPAALLVIAAFSVLTLERNAVWHDEISLWRDVVAKSPDKARPHTNLGVALKDAGNLDGANAQFKLALKVEPDYEPDKAHYNLGVDYIRQGRTSEGVDELQQALAIRPDFIQALSNLGAGFMTLGKYDQATEELRKAIELEPDLLEAHYNLGICYQVSGQTSQAIAEFEEVLRINPDFAQARKKLADLSKPQA